MPPEEQVGPGRTEWTSHGERSVYRTHWVDVRLADVEAPDGQRFEHHVLRMQRVAAVAVLDEASVKLLMIRRHRFIDGSWGWEVPMGIVERQETAIDAAAREVLEETGWQPGLLRKVLEFQPTIGIADTPHELFLGIGAQRQGAPTDVTEADTVAWIPISDLREMVDDGRIRDGATLVAVLYLLTSQAPTQPRDATELPTRSDAPGE